MKWASEPIKVCFSFIPSFMHRPALSQSGPMLVQGENCAGMGALVAP